MTTAMTSRIWINPPMVVPVTKPKSQRISRTTAKVYNIKSLPSYLPAGACAPAGHKSMV